MTTVMIRSSVDEETSEKRPLKSTTVTKLLSRPQTAVSAISPTKPGNQNALSSIEVIGQDAFKDGIDIKKRVKSAAVSGQSLQRANKYQQPTTEGLRRSSAGLSRIRSATFNANHNDASRMKGDLLRKSFSSPNFGHCLDSPFSVTDGKRETIQQSRSIVRKSLRESNKKSLSIRSASVVLISRPKSSVSVSSKFSLCRPKTAHAGVSQEFQQTQSKIVKERDGNGNVTDPDDANKKTVKDEPDSKSPNPNACHCDIDTNSAVRCDKFHTKQSTKGDAKDKLSSGKEAAAVASNLLGKNDVNTKPNNPYDEINRASDPCSECVDNNSDGSGPQRKKGEISKQDETSLYSNVYNALHTFEESNICDSPVSHRSSPRKVTSHERELSPVYCLSPHSKHTPRSLPNPSTWDTANTLIPHIGIKGSGDLPSDVQLNLSETLNNITTTPNSPSSSVLSLSSSSSKLYKMAKVEMYEKNTVKQGPLSVLEEIKKQNRLLEERNSESRSEESQSKRPKPGLPGECGKEMKNETLGFAEKGNICGSPGFKFISEQLRGINSTGRPKSLTLTTKKLGLRDQQGDGFLKKSDKESKLNGIRPLSDYILKSSPDSLRVTGGACTYKSGEDAVSSAAGSIATQAGIVSKVSVQGTSPTKWDSSNLDSNINADGVNLQSKVHVSLSYLKEKNRVNSGAVAFRHRFDGHQDENANDRSSSGNDNGAQRPPADKNYDKDGSNDGCMANTNSQESSSSKQTKTASLNACDDSGTENTDADKAENDTERTSNNRSTSAFRMLRSGASSKPEFIYPDSLPSSLPWGHSECTVFFQAPFRPGKKVVRPRAFSVASSTPSATFSGSDLLYPNDAVHRSHGEEFSASDMPGYERERQKLRDLEIGNRRPASRSKKGSYSVVDKVSFDRERDDLRALNNSLPAKTPALRNPVQRNSLVRGEPMISNRSHASSSNRESDDLIAMGTIWSPANNNNNNNNNSSNGGGGGSSTAPTRSSSNTTGSNKSIPLNNNNIGGGGNSNGGMNQRKPVTVSLSTSSRLGHCNGTTTGGGGGVGVGGTKNTNRDNVKEVEAKYSDPLIGAPASFQQRLMDLASLEAETIRWERTKRVKKKAKDRDS